MNVIYLLIAVEILVVLLVSGFLLKKVFKPYITKKKSKKNKF